MKALGKLFPAVALSILPGARLLWAQDPTPLANPPDVTRRYSGFVDSVRRSNGLARLGSVAALPRHNICCVKHRCCPL